ncbi:MAG: type VI secretion system membrane subunit TssM [Gammaproteobacteria bacterium]
MKRFFGFFKNRWVVSIIGLLALCILIWFVGPQIAFAGQVPLAGEVARLIAITAVLLIWGLNNLRIQMQINSANAQMISGFAEPSMENHETSSAAFQSDEEVQALQERFDEALQVLKKTARKRGGAGIYDLPWYIIIGPPGSGKTTALVNSGLKFPLSERFGKEALRGVGGTRNCDWWFTEEAVLLDTAGRYTTQDSQLEVDSAAWEGFLGLLKKHRRRRPINGALIAVSLSDLLLQSEAERAQHVRAIKQRLQELHKVLGIRFPVYVLFTKCDLIAGFMEFFEDLGVEERSQVWGMTFPVDKKDDSTAAIQSLGSEFDALLERINQRVLWRMQQERDPKRRASIFAFPQQLASLRGIGIEFLTEVFRPSRFEDPPMLRGMYFSSGTQEGTPIDRVMGALARTFGVGQQGLPTHGGQGRSYFLTRLLRDVVFQEADLVGANRRLEVQRRWLQRAAYAGAVAITVAAVLAWTTSFTRNQVYVSRAQDRIEEFKQMSATPLEDRNDFAALLPQLNALGKVTEVYKPFSEGVPLLMGMGLYQGRSLSEDSQQAYQRKMGSMLLPAISHRLEQQLESGGSDPDFQYEALKTYLMLGHAEHLDPDLLKLWMELDWANTFAAEPDKQGQLQNHLAALLQQGIEPVELNKEIVNNTRRSLKQVPLSQLLYGRMKRDYIAFDKQPFRLSDVMGPAGAKVFERASGASLEAALPGLFTYDGYHGFFKKQVKNIAQQSSEESWVLDPQRLEFTQPEIEKLQEDLQALYFSDYVREWKKLLGDINIKRFRSARQAVEVTDLLSSPLSPMRGLLQAVAHHTTLGKPAGLLAAAVDKLEQANAKKSRLARLLSSATENEIVPVLQQPTEVVDKAFKRLDALVLAPSGGNAPLDQLLDLLSQLYGQLDSMSSGLGNDALSVAMGSSAGDISRRLQVEGARQPEPVKRWLQQIASNSRAVTMGGARSELNKEWKAAVQPICGRALNGRYPFFRNASKEMTLADFGRIFAPGGLIDNFFNTNLKAFVNQSGSSWRWQAIGNTTLGISNSVLRQFQRAAQIRDAFFQSGGASPLVSFGLKPVYLDANVRSFRLDLEGQEFRYRHGPARVTRAQWPGPDSTGQVRIDFEDDSGARLSRTKEGPWAWFRLLDEADLQAQSSDRMIASFTSKNRKSSWEIQADSVINPFMMQQLQQFRCPGRL